MCVCERERVRHSESGRARSGLEAVGGSRRILSTGRPAAPARCSVCRQQQQELINAIIVFVVHVDEVVCLLLLLVLLLHLLLLRLLLLVQIGRQAIDS